MRANDGFHRWVGLDRLVAARDRHVSPWYRRVLESGWVCVDGAWLLRTFHTGYHGDRDRFADRTAYEAAVNGRGVPDTDLSAGHAVRYRELFIRGHTFARRALRLLADKPGRPPGEAIVSVSPTADGDTVTGAVTFVIRRSDEPPYIVDLRRSAGTVVAILDIEDCGLPGEAR
ncbi:hypothetical protein LX16_4431 [Stackebrandtia albiflava]|uniref:Uncharacterized protein n=1 Tax=Stackebrandtia albiflava TaxID=406432 RepID=A0A562URG1_9ACTN|nr:hypothetical protein [Stackebrandtia albiflava]TWJ08210.1 hypothetical protein LX16_4431 [Stackebrandtia albiflava]